jgi:DnaJ-class molecular chaperone
VSAKCRPCKGKGMVIDPFGDSTDCDNCGGSGQD